MLLRYCGIKVPFIFLAVIRLHSKFFGAHVNHIQYPGYHDLGFRDGVGYVTLKFDERRILNFHASLDGILRAPF